MEVVMVMMQMMSTLDSQMPCFDVLFVAACVIVTRRCDEVELIQVMENYGRKLSGRYKNSTVFLEGVRYL